MAIHSVLDATSRDIAPFVRKRVQDFEELRGQNADSLKVSCDLFDKPEGLMGAVKRVFEPLMIKEAFLGLGALAVGATWLAGGPYVALSLTAGAIGLATGALLLRGATGLKDSLAQLRWDTSKGLTKFDIQPDKSSKIDSKPVHKDPTQMMFKADDVKAGVLANQKNYPGFTQMVHIFGHGSGHLQMAGRSVSEFSTGLKAAKRETGKPVDCVILESCLMGNLETLASLQGTTKAVVASEPTLKTQAGAETMPLPEMLQAGMKTDCLEDFAKVLDGLPKSERPDHLAIYDMEAFESKLMPSIESLGQKLTEKLKSKDQQQGIIDALGRTTVIDDEPVPLVDMGSFLLQLAKDESIRKPSLEAYLALSKAVPVQHEPKTGTGDFPDMQDIHSRKAYSGLSFSPFIMSGEIEGTKFSSISKNDFGPGWIGFLEALAPAVNERASTGELPKDWPFKVSFEKSEP